MARYEYTCDGCGPFEITRPIATAPPSAPCPGCGGLAPRRFTMPAVTAPRSALRRAADRAERSAHEPVVTGRPPPGRPPPRAARAPAADPRQAKLPRP